MEWEFTVLNQIQQMRTDFLDKLMPCITFLGQWSILWIVIAILCLAFRQKRNAFHSKKVAVAYSTVTDFARLRGLSTSSPFATLV